LQTRFKNWIPPSIPAVHLADHYLAAHMIGGSATPNNTPAAGPLITNTAPMATTAAVAPGALNATHIGPAAEGTQNPIEWNSTSDVRIKARLSLMGTLKNILLQAGGGQEPSAMPKHDDGLDMCLTFQ
jgi:hypothetical protein